MKKGQMIIAAVSAVMLAAAGRALAVTTEESFTVKASIPAATGSSINVSKVSVDDGSFSDVAGTTLDFNTGGFLPFDADNQIYAPDHFFAIDVAGSGGAGNPDVTVSYSDTTTPVGQVNGLGHKATATFIKVTGAEGDQTEEGIAAHGPKKKLLDVDDTILKTEFSGGFLRIYIGIVTKDEDATFPDPEDSEPFTNADQSGTYEGTFTISATVP